MGRIDSMANPLASALIVMPAHNEEEALSTTLAEVHEKLPGATVLVVNDGSTDHTSAVARANGALVLDLPFNLGVGGAMRLGFKYAAENNFSTMVQLDADGQHDPANVPALIDGLQMADVVIGARFAGVGDYSVRGPRKWAMKVLSGVISTLLGTTLTDTTSGFKAHGPAAIRLYKDDFPAEYLGDTIEALIIGHRAGLNFAQHPVAMRDRLAGEPSQNGLTSAIYLVRAFLALMLAFIRPKQKQK